MKTLILTFGVLIFSVMPLLAQISFTEHVIIQNYNAWSVVGIDMDRDGDNDIVGSARLTGRIDWWENDGKQNFTRRPVSQNAPYAMGISVADLDGDNDLDVVCGLNQGKKLNWYENDGRQNFAEHTIANWVVDLVYLADVNKDGRLDVLASACEQGDNKMGWFENTGTKTFIEHVVRANWDHANSVCAADLDADGDVDILGTASFRTTSSYGEIAWFENDGQQNFTERNIKKNFGRPSQVSAADVDGDGDVDVLATVCHLNQILWFENDGSQHFTQHTIGTNFTRPRDVHATDLDQDGDLDILATAIDANQIAWWENDGRQNFTKHIITAAFVGATEIFLKDLDQDGDLDLLGAAQHANKISWFENNTISTGIRLNQDERTADPERWSLVQNYPNPFNTETIIAFQLTEPALLDIHIFDRVGRRLAALAEHSPYSPGPHSIQWSGRDDSGAPVSTGIYFCIMTGAKFNAFAKMTCIR